MFACQQPPLAVLRQLKKLRHCNQFRSVKMHQRLCDPSMVFLGDRKIQWFWW